MAATLPLFAQVSHLYTAFTVSCDNRFELSVPHRTTGHGGTPGAPWLVSSSLWFRFLRHIPPHGEISLSDLKHHAALPTNELKMWITRFESWWGYLRIDPATKMVRPTAGGRIALEAFPIALAETEAAWRKELGTPPIEAIAALTARLEETKPLPPCLSTLNYGLYTTPNEHPDTSPAMGPYDNSLPALLAKFLYAFALDYERESFLALAVSANVLRLIPPQGVAVRTLPAASGIARGAMANALKLLLKSNSVTHYVTTEFTGKALRRTGRGNDSHALFEETIAAVETQWRKQFGTKLIDQLKALPSAKHLLAATKPQPGNWRANVPAPTHLPWFPIILHRGGFPDGS